MSVTLGQNRAQTNQTNEISQNNAAMSPKDVSMDSSSTNDPLKNAAAHDGPRASEQANLDRAAAAQVDMAQVVESLEVFGDIPQARFGHTITIVSKSKVVLFGGATGDTGKYSMTGETFLYNILNKTWQKLQSKSQKQFHF